MGCRTSCNIFEEFSTAIEWIPHNKLILMHMQFILLMTFFRLKFKIFRLIEVYVDFRHVCRRKESLQQLTYQYCRTKLLNLLALEEIKFTAEQVSGYNEELISHSQWFNLLLFGCVTVHIQMYQYLLLLIQNNFYELDILF